MKGSAATPWAFLFYDLSSLMSQVYRGGYENQMAGIRGMASPEMLQRLAGD
jgi:hypothetical protein